MKSFTINKNDADQRLDKFITKSVPLLPKTLLYKTRTSSISRDKIAYIISLIPTLYPIFFKSSIYVLINLNVLDFK